MNATVFTKPGCPYCVAAKQLLVKKNIPYVERDITERVHWDEIKSLVPGFRTVPQVFLDDRHIGGFDDLVVHLKQAAEASRASDSNVTKTGLAGRLAGLFGGNGAKKDE